MRKVLIPVDGSKAAESAVRSVVQRARRDGIAAIHLLNVQPVFSQYVGRFVGGRAIREYQDSEAASALARPRGILDAAGLAYTTHVRCGDMATTIASLGSELGVDEIVMAGEGEGLISDAMARLLLSRVLRYARVPVVVIKRPPAGVGVGLPTDRLQPS